MAAGILDVFQGQRGLLWRKRCIQNRVNPYVHPPNAPASMAVGVDDPGCVEQDMEYCVRLYAQETTPIKP